MVNAMDFGGKDFSPRRLAKTSATVTNWCPLSLRNRRHWRSNAGEWTREAGSSVAVLCNMKIGMPYPNIRVAIALIGLLARKGTRIFLSCCFIVADQGRFFTTLGPIHFVNSTGNRFHILIKAAYFGFDGFNAGISPPLPSQ